MCFKCNSACVTMLLPTFTFLMLTIALQCQYTHLINIMASPCDRLYLKGLDNDSISPWIYSAGVYVYVKPIVTPFTFLVYHHELHPRVRFVFNITKYRNYQFSLIDNDFAVLTAPASNWNPQLSSTPFSQMISHWNSYTLPYHIDKSAIQPTCVTEDFFQCDSGNIELTDVIQVTLNNHLYYVHRFSQVIGLYSSLRPVFNADVGHSSVVYLYHLNNSWMIGNNYLSTEAIARSHDTALRPEFITNDWHLIGKDNTHSMFKKPLKIKCAGLSLRYAHFKIYSRRIIG